MEEAQLTRIETKLDLILDYQRKAKRRALFGDIFKIIFWFLMLVLPLYFSYVAFNNFLGSDYSNYFNDIMKTIQQMQ
jgi:hypothetical protein